MSKNNRLPIVISIVISLTAVTAAVVLFLQNQSSSTSYLADRSSKEKLIESLNLKINELESEDQRKKNASLSSEISQIHDTYLKSLTAYEALSDLKAYSKTVTKLDESYARILNYLAAKNYASASALITTLNSEIASEKQKTVTAAAPVITAPQSNTPPGSGFSRQTVSSDAGNFTVSLVAADLSSTKVYVDTASSGDCGNNCPVLPLATYVTRNNAFAAINGSYFCPSTYPTCAGKTNSFDLLVMNKNKTYFNSANNVYSSNPAVIFGGGYIRFVSSASLWGRDTGVDGVLSNYPLLVSGGSVVFGGDADPKSGSKGGRSFVGSKGNTVYIGVVHSATLIESATTLKALGLENALNLDDGGSTALWSGGYKLGPGRDLPNAILFVKK